LVETLNSPPHAAVPAATIASRFSPLKEASPVAKKTIVIDGEDREHFFLRVNSGVLELGNHPARPDGVMRGLRVARIRCEIEVETDTSGVSLEAPPGNAEGLRDVRPGDVVRFGHVNVTLLGESSTSATETMPSLGEPEGPALVRFLRIVDGADKGRIFSMPESGQMTVGKSGKYSDIALHDLFVARVHCRLEVDHEDVIVTHMEGDAGTFVDGVKLDGPRMLKPGNIIRVGNSYLRLEVGEHTASEVEDDADFEVLAPVPAGPTSGRRLNDPSEPLVGQSLGHYQVQDLLGKGFVSKAFRAIDSRSGHSVTLKVFPSEFPANQKELDRFALAIKGVSQVHHPNLITLAGAGKTGTNFWLAREYVDGESAAMMVERVAEGTKPNSGTVLRIAAHLARALGCLHEHQLVHGNITPRNVLVRMADQVAKLTDLGLAKALDGSQLRASTLKAKQTAEIGFQAPEQVESGAFVDDLADLYAVGAVMYALLTGRAPFTGDSTDDIRDQILHSRVTKPTAYQKKIPAALETMVMKLLARLQEERYPSATVLHADIEKLAGQLGVDL